MNIFKRLVILSVATLLTIATAAPVFARSMVSKNLAVYASIDTDWIAKAAQEFEKETGIHVAWIRESTGVILQRLMAEKSAPKADVWFGGTIDGHANAATAGLLEAYTPKAEANLGPLFRNPLGNHLTSGIYGEVIGFSVNKELLTKQGKPIPQTWDDLLNPAYKGLIAMPNPNTSGTGYTILTTIVKLKGEEPGFAYLKKLHANMAQYTQSGSGPSMLAGKGEIAIAILNLHDSVKTRLQGYPLVEILPTDGTGYGLGGLSLIKGSANSDAAKQFIDWLLEPRVQQIAARAGAFQVPTNTLTPIDPNIVTLAKAKTVDLPVSWVAASRDRLIKRWSDEVFTAAK